MSDKTITNEDILETLQTLMQMTSDGFQANDRRFDGLDGRMDRFESRMDKFDGRMDRFEGRMDKFEGRMVGMEDRMINLERQYSELQRTVDMIAGEQKAQANDIKEILDRLLAIEKRLPNITEAELREMKSCLQQVVDWAKQIAVKENITLKLA